MATDPISDQPLDVAPNGFVPTEKQQAALLAELAQAGVELGEYDKRMVAWVAGWDWMTVATIASWIRRAGSGS